ncbi:muts domain V-domain-containing protein [Butyriboletus roseoflavus]|nr:muts domain V-domain-containing protein [Butyriboletus roseoflavus]
MKNFNIYDPMKRGRNLVLDGQTLSHIEVLQNNEGTDEGSLHKLLSRCITPFGKRLFRIWLCVPLRDAKDINDRLDAVQELINHGTFEEEFTKLVKGLPDLERIVSRIHAKNCKVKDFIKVLSAFKKLNEGVASLADNSESFASKTILGLLRSAPDLTPHLKNVTSRFTIDKETDELLPVDGKDDVYDGVMEEITNLEKELDGQLKKFEKKLGCSLSWWHSGTGNKEIYLIQTKAKEENIPDDWVKGGATKAVKRWVVPSLQPTVRALKEARENRTTAVKEFKARLFEEFDTDRGVWLRAIRVLAELDCLFSLAKASVAIGEPSCRPEFVEGDAAFIEFKDLRHPTLAALKTSFIPNDIKLGGDVGRIALLTGPNMGGKSTAMRMTATGVIMAQLGMRVPAQSARLCPVDAILTRMGAYDNMFSNASTFKVELDECCKILRDATPRSLVILDELGRGTSTYDGMAIAGAVLHELATRRLPLAFFATHYGSLTDDFAYHPNIRNMHMSTSLDDEQKRLIFLYKLVDGVASSSFGTHVASLAGVPSEVVSRAEVVSEDFARQFKARIDGKKKQLASKLPLVAQADFRYLLALASGDLKLPDDPYKKRELLRVLKNSARAYLS